MKEVYSQPKIISSSEEVAGSFNRHKNVIQNHIKQAYRRLNMSEVIGDSFELHIDKSAFNGSYNTNHVELVLNDISLMDGLIIKDYRFVEYGVEITVSKEAGQHSVDSKDRSLNKALSGRTFLK